MPRFIDYHSKLPPLPPEVAQQMKAQVQSGKANQFGVKGINIYFGKGGQAYCLSEAPNAEAILKTHEAAGVPLGKGDIVEVTSLV